MIKFIKKNYLLFILFIVLLVLIKRKFYPSTLTVASYNIDSETFLHKEEQVKLIKENDVDIVGLQEVNQNSQRFQEYGINNYNDLIHWEKEYPYQYFGQTESFPFGDYGHAVVSKYKIINSSIHKFRQSENLEARAYTRSLIRIGLRKVSFYNLHLSYEDAEVRQSQMQQIYHAMKKDKTKYIIAVGDFNNYNSKDSMNELNLFIEDFKIANYGSVDTFIGPEYSPNRSIDHVIVSKNFNFQEIKIVKSNLSDHLPVVVQLKF